MEIEGDGGGLLASGRADRQRLENGSHRGGRDGGERQRRQPKRFLAARESSSKPGGSLVVEEGEGGEETGQHNTEGSEHTTCRNEAMISCFGAETFR